MNGSNFGHIPALLIWSNMWKKSSRILAKNIKLILYRHLPVEPRQVQIEQHEQRHGMCGPRIGALFQEVIDGLLAIAERDDLVGNVGATQVTLDQARMARIIFNQEDRDRLISRHAPLLLRADAR